MEPKYKCTKEMLELRQQKELEIKETLAAMDDINGLAKFLANEKLLDIERELYGAPKFTVDSKYEPPTHPLVIDLSKIFVYISGITLSIAFYYIIARFVI